MTSAGHRRFGFGAGAVLIAQDGAVAAVEHPDGRAVLLQEDQPELIEAAMHSPAWRWGKGFLITDRGGERFDAPTTTSWVEDGVELTYDLGAAELAVTRRVGSSWRETYALTNTAAEPVTVGSLAISTPWRDVYGSSRDSLRGAVHAHVWTGGADAWVWAVPMDGSAPGLGLRLTEGELWAYSVESRDQFTSSNVRGHLYLHVTDHARAPHAMGGQPELVLAPGETLRWSWQLDWYATLTDFRAARPSMLDADPLAAEVGTAITIRTAPGVALSESTPVVGTAPGVRHVEALGGGRRSRISLVFHPPLREIAEYRVHFALAHQRPTELADSRRGAFVPYNNDTGLRVLPGAWRDWSDRRERVGTALLLQEVRRRGWGDRAQLDAAIEEYRRFVVEHVVTEDGTVTDGPDGSRPRLYNFPWFARFLLDAGDLDRAVAIMDRFYTLGGGHFLAFELGGVLTDLAGALRTHGRDADAARMEAHLLEQARTFVAYGEDLPAHEVNYEQSVVAPLLDLLLAARGLAPEDVGDQELLRRRDWLTAFAADQPDARMRHLPIRHWDGYWFGGLRLWGDVYPHYWSILTAAVFLSWPEDLGAAGTRTELRAAAHAILRSNLSGFFADGSATCAFVYPSCVNGRPAHIADPLANDQDWALVYALRWGLG